VYYRREVSMNAASQRGVGVAGRIAVGGVVDHSDMDPYSDLDLNSFLFS
jgi:hypothetical protein